MSVAPTETEETLMDRLRAATVAHKDAQEVARRLVKPWRRLVVEAVDAGVRIKDVAEAAGVSTGRVHAIILHEESRP